MKKRFHIEICQNALGNIFSAKALNIIIAANISQDGLRGQIGHPEFHFDNSEIELGIAYIEAQHQIIWDTIRYRNNVQTSWVAFGRLIHAAQDFYAHTNYIPLWADHFEPNDLPIPEHVDPIQAEILSHPELRSGKVYFWDWLAFIPGLHNLAKSILPPDSHTHMNLDSPDQGPFFQYAFEAANKRTILEYQKSTKMLDPTGLPLFLDQ
jgi:hypothetical protein